MMTMLNSRVVLRETLQAALAPYNMLPLEADGMTRLLAGCLTQAGFQSVVTKRGQVHLGGITLPEHYWLDLAPDIRVDFRSQALGEGAPFGVFDPRVVVAQYVGIEDPELLNTPPAVLKILAGGIVTSIPPAVVAALLAS
jgi:hypothetical protein